MNQHLCLQNPTNIEALFRIYNRLKVVILKNKKLTWKSNLCVAFGNKISVNFSQNVYAVGILCVITRCQVQYQSHLSREGRRNLNKQHMTN